MRVLVTGANPGGIGGEICRKLARDADAKGLRAKIVAATTGTRPGDADEIISDLRALGADALSVTGDLADPSVPARLVAEAVAFCGGLDALVANAGLRRQGPLLDLSVEDWDAIFAVNTRATWLLARAAHPALKQAAAEGTGGSIVAITSIAADYPQINYGAYTPSKAAEASLVQLLATEWAGDGIRVNAIAPGIIRTRHAAAVYANAEFARARNAIVPLGRIGQPADIAGVVASLLSPDCAYVTGQHITVDGGFAATVMARVPGRPPAAHS